MASAVDELGALIPPPGRALPSLDWAVIEGRLGFGLPFDYKRLVEVYGEGSFDGFMWVLQPTENNPNTGLMRQHEARLDALRTLRGGGEEVPFGVNRGTEELAPWAITDNGDVCFWVMSTSEDPEEWKVAVNEARGPRWEVFPLSASEFLVAVHSGAVRVELFPEDFPSEVPAFRAAST